MTIAASEREEGAATLRRWLDMTGESQIHLPPADVFEGGWVTKARCGQWNDDAPDPEVFFGISADDPLTYVAQSYCLSCPVRRYCDERATRAGFSGMWGGIFRLEDGRFALLCGTPGCFRFRSSRGARCSRCLSRDRSAQARRDRERQPGYQRAYRARLRKLRQEADADGGQVAV